MRTHVGAVRSFDLGGASTTAGRRWAARCSCGAVATTGAWPEALDYLSEHRRVTADVRAVWVANRPGPDLRRVEYPRLSVVSVNGHDAGGDNRPASVVQQLMAGVLSTVARVVLGIHSFATGG
jgi:hypothetical protein